MQEVEEHKGPHITSMQQEPHQSRQSLILSGDMASEEKYKEMQVQLTEAHSLIKFLNECLKEKETEN